MYAIKYFLLTYLLTYLLRVTAISKLEEASTHKSAKTHVGTVFVTRGLDPQNKWVSRTQCGTFCVKFGDSRCIGFPDTVRKNRDTLRR